MESQSTACLHAVHFT
jgi:hypothetical protein